MSAYTTLGSVRSATVAGRALVLECGGPRVAISVLTDTLVRVRLAPAGQFAPRRSWAVARAETDFPPASFAVEEGADTIVLRTAALCVRIERSTGRVSFADEAGRDFAADAAALEWSAAGAVAVSKQIASGERFCGFGERGGLLEKTGRRMINWTTDPARPHGPGVDPLYQAIPIYLALRPGLAYGVFFNNTWRSALDVGRARPGVLRLEADGGEADYYVAYGPTPAEVVAQWGQLLGTMPLPPRWALGHHQSRWGYKSAADFRALAAEFRARGLPCDVLHFDIDYMRGYRVFTWDPGRLPDPAALIADLRAKGFRAVTIIDPGVKADPDYAVYQEGLARDYFIRRADGAVAHGYVWPDDSVFADFLRPEVRAWWGGWQRVLTEAGVSGVWNDMNEPAVFGRPFSEGGGEVGTLPVDAPQGPADERTTHAEAHNLFGLEMVRASYEGLRALLADERPFTLTRSGYAGVQRWSAVWMGDNHSWWDHLEMALPQLLNMGLSGVPFVGVDIGGFGDNSDGELLTRWIQFGVLMPFCRNHSADDTAPQEPWVFGPAVEAIYRDYVQLRYRLLPYLYSLFHAAAQTGAPLLRPLLYHFPEDAATYSLHDEVMLGPALLAAPILRPGQRARAVYLPAGEWYDWHTGERLHGPGYHLAAAPLERLPLYVRAGSVIPLGPVMQFTDEKPLDPLTLLVAPGAGEFQLYEDDGHTYAYERGEHSLTRYQLHQSAAGLRLSIAARAGAYQPGRRQLIVKVLGGGQTLLEDDGTAREVAL